MTWFDVSKNGLRKLVENRPKSFIFYELLQNAWDENTTSVEVSMEKLPGRPRARIVVSDDSPDGFAEITHAWTLFEESKKKNDPTKRGRFNLGEKLILALCYEASITTTTGGVKFDENGRTRFRSSTEKGSIFEGILKMTQEDFDAALVDIKKLLPPLHIKTLINGEILPPRQPRFAFEVVLPTVTADDEGNLKPTTRKTIVEIHEPQDGETASIYEMGIPVVETGDRYHVNVMQKVPLNSDRDNVTPSYLRKIRAEVLNAMSGELTKSDSQETWVTDAITHKDAQTDALNDVLTRRYGDKRVTYDPSDREANHRATAQGYTVIHGGSFPKEAWDKIKAANLALPAGRVTPSHPEEFEATEYLPRTKWPETISIAADHAAVLALKLMGIDISISVINNHKISFIASYRRGKIPQLTFNIAHFHNNLIAKPKSDELHDLLIHEFGHQYSDNHLSNQYYEALTRLGAKMVRLALTQPNIFS